MKKYLALLLAVVMVLSLAACGSKTPAATDAPTAATTPAATDAPAATEPTAEAPATYTYHTYSSSLAVNWNPHTWEYSNDSTMLDYVTTPLATMSILDSEEGIYQWIYQAATSIEDVTADHQDDLVKYGCDLPEGMEATDVTSGYVYEIALNPEMRWETGEAINADTYVYSMQQLLNPDMLNYRANLYYAGESAVAGGEKYYYANQEGMWKTVSAAGYESVQAAADAGANPCIDVWNLWGAEGYTDAEGNECPQYVPFDDETVYGEAQDDAFTGAELWAAYGAAYIEVGGSYEASVFVANENMGATYEDVGFYKVDDYTVRYVCQTQLSRDYFLSSCTSNWLVYEDLYEAGKDTTGTLVTTSYNTNMQNQISYGPYKLTSIQEGKQMILVQNEEWYGFEKQADGSLLSMTDFEVDGESVQQYMTTSVIIDVMTDDAAKQAFLKGELSDWTTNAEEAVVYATSDRLYKVDETYTESFFMCVSLDKLQEMDASKGNTNSVVLSNIKFRKAMSLAIDRNEFVTATAGWKPAYGMLNSLYMYNAYEDPTSSYRNSEQAMQAICNVYGVEYGEGTPYATLQDAYKSINGYNLTEAKALMTEACAELVADGLYTEGDPIYIRMGWKKGTNDSADNQQIALINKYVNAALEGTGFGTITFEGIDNVASRYDDVANGEFAIGWGAWGGAAFYPFRNFQVYCDPDQYSIHEAGSWDPKTTNLTLTVEGEEVTMSWQAWSQCMVGTGKFANASFETKLGILSAMEENYLQFYYRIPFATTTSCSLLSYQMDYYTEDYNIMYGFGGIQLMTYNYSDAEWADFVASQGGTLNYE